MILSLIVIAIIGGLTYFWLTRGFFNAFLHLLCTVMAGALAFALWEKTSYFLLGIMPSTGALAFLQGASWGIGLLLRLDHLCKVDITFGEFVVELFSQVADLIGTAVDRVDGLQQI